MKSKRMWAGLAAAAIAGFSVSELVALADLSISPAMEAVATGFTGAAIGAFVARRGFVVPALGLWLLSWAVCVCILYWIAEPTGQGSIPGILEYNRLVIFLSALAVLAGVFSGRAVAQRLGASATT